MWRVPVIPANQEAEAGELPEPRRRRLRWAEIAPSHSRPGWKRETPSQKQNKTKQNLLSKFQEYNKHIDTKKLSFFDKLENIKS